VTVRAALLRAVAVAVADPVSPLPSPRADIQDGDSLSDLHKEISSCDTILERMQEMCVGRRTAARVVGSVVTLRPTARSLSKFQGDLGAISSEIKHLQDRSLLMSVQLRNRKVAAGPSLPPSLADELTHCRCQDAEAGISGFIQSIAVPPSLTQYVPPLIALRWRACHANGVTRRRICDDEVNEAFVDALAELRKRIGGEHPPARHLYRIGGRLTGLPRSADARRLPRCARDERAEARSRQAAAQGRAAHPHLPLGPHRLPQEAAHQRPDQAG
jgi:hypothetical protein